MEKGSGRPTLCAHELSQKAQVVAMARRVHMPRIDEAYLTWLVASIGGASAVVIATVALSLYGDALRHATKCLVCSS